MMRPARLALLLTLAALLYPDSASGTCQSDGRPLCQTFEKPPFGITRVTLSGANVRRTVELTEGRFDFGGLPTGDYSISVTRPSGMMQWVPHTVTIATPHSCENLFISNFPDTEVSGVVTTDEGKPFAKS